MLILSKPQKISAEDHERITAAIRTVEKRTSGEIFAVVAKQSDDYFYIAGFVAAFWALLVGVLVSLASMIWSFELPILSLAIAQLVALLLAVILFIVFPMSRLWFVPRATAWKRASGNAVRQFLAHGIHTTKDRSGVLIFISLAERYAEVVADEGINSKVEQKVWDELVAGIVGHARRENLTEGFIEAIERAGAVLEEHFPPAKGQQNELDDRLIEI